MTDIADVAIGLLSAGAVFLARQTWSHGRELDQFKREVERDFTRKDGLKADIKEAVNSAFAPLNEKVEGILDEQERQSRNMSILLDKVHVPAVDRA